MSYKHWFDLWYDLKIKDKPTDSWVLVVAGYHAVLVNAAGWSRTVEILDGWETFSGPLLIRTPGGPGEGGFYDAPAEFEFHFDHESQYINDAPWFVASGELKEISRQP